MKETSNKVPKPRGTPNPEQPPLKKRTTLRRALSRQASNNAAGTQQTPVRLPPKKQQTIRRLTRGKTVKFKGPVHTADVEQKTWRKPPRKQSTIRRNFKKQVSQPKTGKTAQRATVKATKTKPKSESIKPIQKAMDSDSEEEEEEEEDVDDFIPFKRYKSAKKAERGRPAGRSSGVHSGKGAAVPSTGIPSAKSTQSRDPRLTQGKASVRVKKQEVESTWASPVDSHAIRVGKIAVGITSRPPLKRTRTAGKMSNQVNLPPIDTNPEAPKLSRRSSNRKMTQFVEPEVPGLKKAGSLRRQVLKRGLQRQDTLEMDSSQPVAESSVQNAAALIR